MSSNEDTNEGAVPEPSPPPEAAEAATNADADDAAAADAAEEGASDGSGSEEASESEGGVADDHGAGSDDGLCSWCGVTLDFESMAAANAHAAACETQLDAFHDAFEAAAGGDWRAVFSYVTKEGVDVDRTVRMKLGGPDDGGSWGAYGVLSGAVYCADGAFPEQKRELLELVLLAGATITPSVRENAGQSIGQAWEQAAEYVNFVLDACTASPEDRKALWEKSTCGELIHTAPGKRREATHRLFLEGPCAGKVTPEALAAAVAKLGADAFADA